MGNTLATLRYFASLSTKQLSNTPTPKHPHLTPNTHSKYPLLILVETGDELEYGKGNRTEGLTDEDITGRFAGRIRVGRTG